jgi:hypothetical protein
MIKAIICEAISVLTGFLGAFTFVLGLLQFINPEFVNENATHAYSPRMDFLIPTLVSLPILGVSLYCRKKADRIRRGLKTTPKKENDV